MLVSRVELAVMSSYTESFVVMLSCSWGSRIKVLIMNPLLPCQPTSLFSLPPTSLLHTYICSAKNACGSERGSERGKR